MTPLERLLAEAVPTGTFGDAQPPPQPPARPTRPWTPAEQAAHVAELETALDGRAARRHLRPVPDAKAA